MSDDASSRTSQDDSVKPNGLAVQDRPWGLEKVYDYEEGRHHPVHLHDTLHSRYEVLHKLGNGGSATVWLCRDISVISPKYVAVKIIMAEASTVDYPEMRVAKILGTECGQSSAIDYLSLPLDDFEIKGPNGTHFAFVYPVLGPRVSRLPHLVKNDDPGTTLRKICHEATQAMATLHALGLCHGDFRPANVLMRIWGLDGIPQEEVLKILGTPKTTRVITESGESHDLETAPEYLVYPVDWDSVLEDVTQSKLSTGSACLTDFGESFEMDDPPAEVGIPQVYCAPEQALEQRLGKGCDLWALGCTLFEIRTGRKLFETFDDDVDEYLYAVAEILGKLPEPWWSDTWQRRKDLVKDETDDSGKVVGVHTTLKPQEDSRNNAHTVSYERPRPRSLEEAISRGLVYEGKHSPLGLHRDIAREEAKIFADLLGKLLRYAPEERIEASSVLEHEWFRLGT